MEVPEPWVYRPAQVAREQSTLRGSITVIVMEWPSREAAEGFMSDPTLAEAMQRGGILVPPTVTFGERA